METTPLSRRAASTVAGQMQSVLHNASSHPPPTTSLGEMAVSTSAGGGVAPELMSIGEGLNLAILCANNTIRAACLLDLPEDSTSKSTTCSSGMRGTPAKTAPPRTPSSSDEDPFHLVSFSADCTARPGDDTIPSDSIPPKTPIQGLEFSPSGHSLLIWGESYVAVARLPRSAVRGVASNSGVNGAKSSPPPSTGWDARSGGGGRAVGGIVDPGARWKWTLVDMSGYAVDVMRQRVVQAAWHPASDNCVILLTVEKEDVDGAMTGVAGASGARGLMMLHVPGRERPEQVLPIPEGPSKLPPVAFAHGQGSGWQRFTLWIARKDGSLAALCPVVPRNAKVDSEELLDLWSVTCDMLVAARWERSSNGGENEDALDEEVLYLEQQQGWLRETFGDVFDEMGATSPPDDNSAALVAVSSPNRRGEEEQHHRYSSFQQQIIAMGRHPPRNLVLQDDIIAGRSADSKSHSPDNRAKGRIEDAGTACGLVVLAGAAGGAGGPDDGAAASPPPTVIAVAYRAGIVDIALIPAGVSPRWSRRPKTRISCLGGGGSLGIGGAGFLESLDLAERVSDKSSRRRQGGLALSAGAGAWTLLASTPYRVASITVSWAARVEKLADYARERAALGRPGGGSNRLDSDLRAILRERPDSSVAEVLFVPPACLAGRIVGVAPVANPVVGHLALARLAGGCVEVVNLAVLTLQASEVASATKRARALETPGRGDMLPPFEATVQKAADELEERRLNAPLGSSAEQLLMSELDRQGVGVMEKEADRVVGGGVVVLEKLHLKTSTRLQTLREVYDHQAQLIATMSKNVGRLRGGQEDAVEKLEEICDMADEQRERSAGALAVVQAVRPDVSPAERAFMAEMKDMENYADRQQVMMEPATKQVEELRMAEREAENFLLREAEGVGGAGTGLSEEETRDVWNMLQADRERIFNLNRRMERARARLAELGVREEE